MVLSLSEDEAVDTSSGWVVSVWFWLLCNALNSSWAGFMVAQGRAYLWTKRCFLSSAVGYLLRPLSFLAAAVLASDTHGDVSIGSLMTRQGWENVLGR